MPTKRAPISSKGLPSKIVRPIIIRIAMTTTKHEYIIVLIYLFFISVITTFSESRELLS